MTETTQLEKKKGNITHPQLTNKALQDQLRGHVPHAIESLVKLLDSPNENARVGAIKVLLAKVLPDLKATELTGEANIGIKIQVIDYGTHNLIAGETTPSNPTK